MTKNRSINNARNAYNNLDVYSRACARQQSTLLATSRALDNDVAALLALTHERIDADNDNASLNSDVV